MWARSNKGVDARRARDIEALRADKSTAESAREALERKAKIYEKLKKGKSGGLSDAQYDALLVDVSIAVLQLPYMTELRSSSSLSQRRWTDIIAVIARMSMSP